MATVKKSETNETKKPAPMAVGPQTDEQGWNGMKLVVLGILTLAAAFTFLYLISPNNNP